MKRNKDTGDLLIASQTYQVLDKCPSCGHINQGSHCSECGRSKLVIEKGQSQAGSGQGQGLAGRVRSYIDQMKRGK